MVFSSPLWRKFRVRQKGNLMGKVLVLLVVLGLMAFITTGCQAIDPATGKPMAEPFGSSLHGTLLVAFMVPSLVMGWSFLTFTEERRITNKQRVLLIGSSFAMALLAMIFVPGQPLQSVISEIFWLSAQVGAYVGLVVLGGFMLAVVLGIIPTTIAYLFWRHRSRRSVSRKVAETS